MKKNKVIIVGGGVSGLSLGIFCQKYGFETVIIEKNNIAGGNLTGWRRNGCYIDNCIHWLNGSKSNTPTNQLFRQIGALDDDTQFHQSEFFYVSEHNGKKVGLGLDLEKTKQNLLDCCPQDKKQIEKFIKATKICIELSKTTNSFSKLFQCAKLFCLYGKKTLEEIAQKCNTPLFKNVLTDYILGEYSIYVLLLAYSSFANGDGKVLKNGSLDMATKIAKYYQSLGGKILLGKTVERIQEEKNKTKVVCSDESFESDIVVFACDAKVTFDKILNTKMPKRLQKMYDHRTSYPIISSFHVAFDVALPKVDIPDSFVFDCPKTKIANTVYDRIMIRNYDYGNNYAPDGHCVLQIFLLTREYDYDYFAKLSKQEYAKQKEEISKQLLKIVTQKFDFLQDKISILDCWTPLTYTRYFDSYKGSYLSFGVTKKVCLEKQTFKIEPFKNVFFATQWQTMFGGLPNAARQGKKCADLLDKLYD